MLEKRIAENGVLFLRSSMLSCRHGFSTRIGGVSPAEHTASLNLAFGRGDSDAVVLENLERFAEALAIDPHTIVRQNQIHSAKIRQVNENMRGEGFYLRTASEGDGLVTSTKNVALAIATADCVPILFEDPENGVIGAAHAGWRGTASGIAAKCVEEMCALGAERRHIRVAIGPAIRFCCYEVGEDFREAVADKVGAALSEQYIRRRDGRLYADLIGLNRSLLWEVGIPEERIDESDFCTYCHPELFYSHRFSHGKRGTLLSILSL